MQFNLIIFVVILISVFAKLKQIAVAGMPVLDPDTDLPQFPTGIPDWNPCLKPKNDTDNRKNPIFDNLKPHLGNLTGPPDAVNCGSFG